MGEGEREQGWGRERGNKGGGGREGIRVGEGERPDVVQVYSYRVTLLYGNADERVRIEATR